MRSRTEHASSNTVISGMPVKSAGRPGMVAATALGNENGIAPFGNQKINQNHYYWGELIKPSRDPKRKKDIVRDKLLNFFNLFCLPSVVKQNHWFRRRSLIASPPPV